MTKNWWWLAAFIVVGILLVAGVLLLVARPPRGEPISLSPLPTPAPVAVHIRGAVNRPGLYYLPAGSRVDDALQAAGGLTSLADGSLLNLAAFLVDGEQVNVPELSISTEGAAMNRAAVPSQQLVDINVASLELLDSLPEIGPKTAQAIIDYRVAYGAFASIEDIMDVPDIGQATFEKIRHLITIGTVLP
jgi:competence protein ComEA